MDRPEMFVNHTEGGSIFCGPAVLSAIIGISTKAATERIRERYPWYAAREIRSLPVAMIVNLLQESGLVLFLDRPPAEPRPTFQSYVQQRPEIDTLYLFSMTDHVAVVNGDDLIDNDNPFGVYVTDYNHRRMRVYWAMGILDGSETDLPSHLPVIGYPDPRYVFRVPTTDLFHGHDVPHF